MSEYKLQDGTLTNESGVRKAFPNTSINFKNLGTMATLVMPTPKPTCDELERVVRDGTTADGLGNLTMAWKTVDMFSDKVEDGVTITKAEQETAYLAKKTTEAYLAKVKEGEAFVNGLVKVKLDEFNKQHGTVFTTVNDMGIYTQDTEYYLQTECIIMTKWNNLLWATSRLNQNDVLNGVISEDDFMAMLLAV